MQAWSKRWKNPTFRFVLIAGLLIVSFSTLLIEPLMVRSFGEPVSLRVRVMGFPTAGSDAFFQLPITEVPVEELSEELLAIVLLDDIDDAISLFRDQDYYIELAEINGVYERVELHTSPPDEMHVNATFGWFSWNENRLDVTKWQDGTIGIQLDIPINQRFFIPLNTPQSTLNELEDGTWVADFRLYQGQLYLIDPNV